MVSFVLLKHMTLHARTAYGSIAALIALVWLFTCVGYVVNFQVRLLYRGIRAEVTLEVFHTSVHRHVTPAVTTLRKCRWAQMTLKRLLTRVASHMCC